MLAFHQFFGQLKKTVAVRRTVKTYIHIHIVERISFILNGRTDQI